MTSTQQSTRNGSATAQMQATRRHFLKIGAAATAGIYLCSWDPNKQAWAQAISGGTLDPTSISKYVDPLIKPPAMPATNPIGLTPNYYEIAVKEFQQQILPTGMPVTTVWSYGSMSDLANTLNYPAFTIEAQNGTTVTVKWINGLDGLPHLLAVDQTLHWANPVAGSGFTDSRGLDPLPYVGPVPIVTHVHGAHTHQESDGYPEAWYLPATGVPDGYATEGSVYNLFTPPNWGPGFAEFQYPNDQRATTLWYHDHTLGMTRLNVYAGPAGFYLIRGGADDVVLDSTTLDPAVLPGPAPGVGDSPFGTYYEIPIVIQDRSFNADGSLFYPDNRAFFEGLNPKDLKIPFIPDKTKSKLGSSDPDDLNTPFSPDDTESELGLSDVSPIWNPEFFGNTMVVNGRTWPFLDVEQRRYRFRLLNGCNSRFLILQFSDPAVRFWQIGADGGFLPVPVDVDAVNDGMLLMSPAERADVIVDFTNVPAETNVTLLNLGPDAPFGGAGDPPSDPATTGQVMEFRVGPIVDTDPSTDPADLLLPVITRLGAEGNTRQLSLNEEESKTVLVRQQRGKVKEDKNGVPFGPTAALLGTFLPDGTGNPLLWSDPVTENPNAGDIEIWEIHNLTVDAHPIHVHLVQFEILGRGIDGLQLPEPGEMGFKDTVIAYPGEITRIKAKFDVAGLYVWHCHIVEHEDNEMMRPYTIG